MASPRPIRGRFRGRALAGLMAFGLMLTGIAQPASVALAESASPPSSARESAKRATASLDSTQLSRGCAAVLRDRPVRLSKLVRDDAALDVVAQRSSQSARSLVAAAVDPALWVDVCGDVFYREAQAPKDIREQQSSPTSRALSAPLADTFSLQSRPGSRRTIYLDFLGGSVSGTAWNNSEGAAVLAYGPFSITAPADTNFTTAELTQIQRVWAGVAEDYAPFDVNVTTADPGYAAISRSSSTDAVFGTRVVITSSSSMYDTCGCGGVAYTDVFDIAGSQHDYYQPAWVFTQGVGTNGKVVADTASHEVGHNFGLDHDGTLFNPYYSGADPWAPLMGTSYLQPITQWSRGEYPGANNSEDDLAIIAANGAPVRPDDAGNSASPASLANNLATGTITSASDQDAFEFQAQGATTISIVDAELSNLDVQLTVLDEAGGLVATANPPAARVSLDNATGLGAIVSANLPQGRYIAVVQGSAGSRPANQSGGYGTYASLGNYTLAVSTEQPDPGSAPLLSAAMLPALTQGSPVSAAWLSATGGTAPYTFTVEGLPAGLTVAPSTGVLSGTPTAAGTFAANVTVTDSALRATQAALSLTVSPASNFVVPDRVVIAAPATTSQVMLTANGAQGAVEWAALGAPNWVQVSPTGTMTLTPPRAGSYFIDVTARETGGLARTATGRVTVDVLDGPVTVATSSLSAEAGQSVSFQLAAQGGTGSYRWSGSGLPPGLALSSDGRISGSAPAAGSYTFDVTAISGSSGQPSAQATRAVALEVAAAPLQELEVADSFFSGTVGSLFTGELSARGGGPNSVSWTANGLPQWLSMTTAGVLSGTPPVEGTYVFQVTATAGASSASATATVVVDEASDLRVTSLRVSGVVGEPVDSQLSTEGARGEVAWVLIAGTLPPGLTLSRSGRLTGTPSTSGQWLVEVEASDGVAVARAMVSVDIDDAGLDTVDVPDQNVSVREDTVFSVKLTATGGDGGYVWDVGLGSALPSGVTLTRDGVLAGKISQAGTFAFTVRATSGQDSTRITGTGTVTLTALPARFRFTTKPRLPAARVGQLVQRIVSTAGGVPPEGSFVTAQWRRTGSLPPGLTARVVNSGSAVMLWGVPRRAGLWAFELAARDGAGRVIRRVFNLRVRR